VTGSSDVESVKKAAGKGYIFATFLQPHNKVRALFDAYRAAYQPNGQPGGGGTAYMPLVYTADTTEEAMKGAQELAWYLNAKAEPQFRNPPGYVPVSFNVMALKGAFSGRTDAMRKQGLDVLMEEGVLICGTPDDVARQVRRLYDLLGGFDHLLMMQQAGFLDHARTVKSMTLFAKEVYPQIKDLAETVNNRKREAAE
jgi:alkanesulfonate monooxygenase SsuD/methylene tetrahydromethanopterin reductase-like flavin-dependent oxidoreductase (luciferase family)